METLVTHRENLYQIIDLSKDTAEVGCAESNFSCDIMRWHKQKHYLIDNWGTIEGQRGDGANAQFWHDRNYQLTVERVKQFGDRAVILQGLSVEMSKEIPDNSLGFVNVDCDHSYFGVRNDIHAYWPKLVSGGVMAFHDYEMTQYGVKQAVKEFALQNGLEIHLLPENKPEDAGAYLLKP